MRKKSELPSKVCSSCGRPFAWRKAWARNWHEARFCSGRCRKAKRPVTSNGRGPKA